MEMERNEVLKNCKYLLRLVNCEAVIDTKDDTLYDILFKSHAKKKMLLSWLIQQLYSTDSCTNISLEDIISMFIHKQHLPIFLSGKMPMMEQYKRWKLIMEVLYQRQKRNRCNLVINVDKEIEAGILLEKYESLWSEKIGSGLNYVGLVSAKDNKFKVEELRSTLDSVKHDNNQLNLSSAAQSFVVDEELFNLDSHSTLVKTLRTSDLKLNHIINENFDSLKPSVPDNEPKNSSTYQQFETKMLCDTKTQLQVLKANIGMFSKLLYGVEDLQL